MLPTGELSDPYGPSPATYARHVARFRDWSYRQPSKEARRDAEKMIAFMRLESGELRADVPKGEQEVYKSVYEQGHSVAFTARTIGLSRRTVRSYLARLLVRLG